MLSITVDFDSPTPVYRQIADELRGLIARGALRDGADLPSVRDLGAAVGVNLNTVAKAYRALADEGLVEIEHGSGARVRLPARPYRDADDDAEKRLEDVVGRLVLRGKSRAEIRELFQKALDRFFDDTRRVR